jgi:hypothetical protein
MGIQMSKDLLLIRFKTLLIEVIHQKYMRPIYYLKCFLTNYFALMYLLHFFLFYNHLHLHSLYIYIHYTLTFIIHLHSLYT